MLSLVVRKETARLQKVKGKGKLHPRTGNEGPEKETEV
jgi:hypothetical protein